MNPACRFEKLVYESSPFLHAQSGLSVRKLLAIWYWIAQNSFRAFYALIFKNTLELRDLFQDRAVKVCAIPARSRSTGSRYTDRPGDPILFNPFLGIYSVFVIRFMVRRASEWWKRAKVLSKVPIQEFWVQWDVWSAVTSQIDCLTTWVSCETTYFAFCRPYTASTFSRVRIAPHVIDLISLPASDETLVTALSLEQLSNT